MKLCVRCMHAACTPRVHWSVPQLLLQLPSVPPTRLFNTLDRQYLGTKQRLLQQYLQTLAHLAAPELPPPAAELLWVEALRRELLDFLHPATDGGADSDEEERASSIAQLYGPPVAAAAAVTASAVSAGAAVVAAAAAAVHRADGV